MNIFKKTIDKRIVYGVLVGLMAANLFLHLYRLSYPATPVFDEVHFATYAADYINGTPRFDMHPPLGKAIYGLSLFLSGSEKSVGAEFVDLNIPTDTNEITARSKGIPFGKFPYLVLRLVSVFFGLLLPWVLYYFLKSVEVGDFGALTGALLVLADTALLLETRLILMDGMLLVFGFTSLAMYFKNKNVWFAGIVFGLGISVKLTAICFIGPIIVSCILSTKRKSEIIKGLKFILSGSLTFILIFVINFIYFPLPANDEYMSSVLRGDDSVNYSVIADESKIIGMSRIAFFSLANYISGSSGTNGLESQWYSWIIGKKSMEYYSEPEFFGGKLLLKGNIVLWWSVALAVILALTLSWEMGKKYFKEYKKNELRAFFLLLGGYVFCILPYVFIVQRATFLYHYFPALFFGIGLLVWIFEKVNIKLPAFLAFVFLIIIGFIINANCAYGLTSCK